MTVGIAAAIRIFQTRTLYVPLPLIILFACLGLFIFVGTLYGAGIIRGATYVGLMIALTILLTIVLLGMAGAYFWIRITR